MSKHFFLLFLTVLAYTQPFAQTTQIPLDSTVLNVEVIATDLEIPWDMIWGPDDWIWFNERKGNINRLNPNTGELQLIHFEQEVFTSPDNSGMHALALHPDFPNTPYIYTHYSYEFFKARLVRYTYDPNTNSVTDSVHILPSLPANDSHNGSRIQFLPDGTFLFAFGECYETAKVQDLNEVQGKIHRFNQDGSVPADNPIAGNSAWCWGVRNPQGLVLAPNGKLYETEHGTWHGDELNILLEGRNFGWPEVEGMCNEPGELSFCADSNVVEPLAVWTPTVGICGMDYYGSDAIPEWENSLLIAFLKSGDGSVGQRMSQVKLNAAGDALVASNEFFVQNFGRLRDVLVSPAGDVYICTSNQEGNGFDVVQADDDKIIRISNSASTGIEDDLADPKRFRLYPNPSSELVMLSFEELGEEIELSVFDYTGRVILQQDMRLTQKNIPFYREDLAAGMYYFSVRFADGKKLSRTVLFVD